MIVKMSEDVKLLVSLFLPFFLIHSVQQIYLTYAILLYQGYGFSYETTGWIIGIYSLAAMLTRPVGGWLLENYGVRNILVWSGILSFIGCSLFFSTESATLFLIGRGFSAVAFGSYFVEPATLLLVGRALSGAAFGIYSMGLFSHQALCVSEKRRGAMFSLLVVGSILPMGIVAPFGEWLLHGSRNVFYLAIGPVLSLFCIYFGGRVNVKVKQEGAASSLSPYERSPEMLSGGNSDEGDDDITTGHAGQKNLGPASSKWGTYGTLFSSRSFLFLIVTGAAIALVDSLTITLSLLTVERGIMVSLFFASVSVTALVVRLPCASFLNGLPRVPLLAPCGILMAFSMAMIALVPSNVVLVVGGILFGAGLGAGWPMYQALISDLLKPVLRPKGTAIALLIYDVGFFITPLLIGYLLPRFGTSATFAAIALTAGAVLALLEMFHWLPLYRKPR